MILPWYCKLFQHGIRSNDITMVSWHCQDFDEGNIKVAWIAYLLNYTLSDGFHMYDCRYSAICCRCARSWRQWTCRLMALPTNPTTYNTYCKNLPAWLVSISPIDDTSIWRPTTLTVKTYLPDWSLFPRSGDLHE